MQVDGSSRSIAGIAGCTPCMAGTHAADGQPNCAACKVCSGVPILACSPFNDAICQSDSTTTDPTNCGGMQVDGSSRSIAGIAGCTPCMAGTHAADGQANC